MRHLKYSIGIIAHSKNFNLLKAAKEALVAEGIPQLDGWNRSWEKQENFMDRLAYLVYKNPKESSGLQYHTHDCDVPRDYKGAEGVYAHYDLPAQWDEFIAAVKDANKPKPTIVNTVDTQVINIAGYVAEVDKIGKRVSFGCQTLTLDQLVVVSELMNNKVISAGLTIRGHKVTKEEVDTLIKQINGVGVPTCSATGYRVGSFLKADDLNKPGVRTYRAHKDSPRKGWNVNTRGNWHSNFIGDRNIEDMAVIDEAVCGLISGTVQVWVDSSTLPAKK